MEQTLHKDIKIECTLNHPTDSEIEIEIFCLNSKGQTIMRCINPLKGPFGKQKYVLFDVDFGNTKTRENCKFFFICNGYELRTSVINLAKKQQIEKSVKRLQDVASTSNIRVQGIFPKSGYTSGGEAVSLYLTEKPKLNYYCKHEIIIDGYHINEDEISFMMNSHRMNYPECKYKAIFETPSHQKGVVTVKMSNMDYVIGEEQYEYKDVDEVYLNFENIIQTSGKRLRE